MTTGARIGVTQTQRLRLSPSLAASLQVLRLDAAGLALFLEEQAAETPALSLRPGAPLPGDWLPRWSGVWQVAPDRMALLPDHAPSMIAHVMAALPALVPAGAERRVALALAEALAPTGWIDRPLRVLAAELAVPLAVVETVLARMQAIDPPGLFARDLSECLALQARAAEVMDAPLAAMLSRLDLLATADWPALARLAGIDEAGVLRRFGLIRGFDPKPGTAFGPVACPIREPDLTARRRPQAGDGGDLWEIALNRAALPALALVEGAGDASLPRAREVMRLVEARNATLLAVAQAILAHQRPALDHGAAALRPLTMQAVADRLDLHKSTVSRVVAGTAVDTPHGTWWLRALFSPDMGADLSGAALRAQLARLIAAEDAARPLSDQDLARALSSNGVSVARRTVAKYRAELRIPPAWRRRR